MIDVELGGRRLALTRRGLAVLGVLVAGVAAGHLFGGRALNAVVMPAAALLVVGAIGVSRVEAPRVERVSPANGFTGERFQVELAVEGADGPVAVRVSDTLSDGLDGETATATVADEDGRTVSYEVTLAERGVHTIGPVAVTATDVFGLWERTFAYEATDDVVAFPRVHPLYEGADIISGYVGLSEEREQFDGVREYERGDALRDVNWKASAKRNEFVVTEYAGEGATNRVTVAVERVSREHADAVAEAAASVVVYLLDAGLSVGLAVPGDRIDPGNGTDHRRRVLARLARFGSGGPPVDANGADVTIGAGAGGARVGVDGSSRSFGDLVAASGTASRGVTA
jgi:uncharacterized protein (DUF58 family)